MIDAFKDVFPGFLGYLVVGILVAGLTWLFDRRWRPQNRRRQGRGLVVSERATRPRDLESPSTPQPSPTLYRNGYTGRKLPNGPHKAPGLSHDEWRTASKAEAAKLPSDARIIDKTVADWMRREGIVK